MNDHTISTAGLTGSIRSAIKGLRGNHPHSRERTIELSEAPDIARLTRRAIGQATPDDVRVLVTVRGGYVPNSYRYRAESDEVVVAVDLATGRIDVTAKRGPAQSRARGIGDH